MKLAIFFFFPAQPLSFSSNALQQLYEHQLSKALIMQIYENVINRDKNNLKGITTIEKDYYGNPIFGQFFSNSLNRHHAFEKLMKKPKIIPGEHVKFVLKYDGTYMEVIEILVNNIEFNLKNSSFIKVKCNPSRDGELASSWYMSHEQFQLAILVINSSSYKLKLRQLEERLNSNVA